MKAYCDNCCGRQQASFRHGNDVTSGEAFVDLCCDQCNLVLATLGELDGTPLAAHPNTDCGPAFPSHGSMGEVAQEGMTLRDYFAAKAMPTLAAQLYAQNYQLEGTSVGRVAAKMAYEYADEMLAARGKS